MKYVAALILALMVLSGGVCAGAEAAPADAAREAAEEAGGVQINELKVRGRMEERTLMVTLEMGVTLEEDRADQQMVLLAGDAVLDEVKEPGEGVRVSYDEGQKVYRLEWAGKTKGSGGALARKVVASFAVRAKDLGDGWREAAFAVPAAHVRQLEVESERADMEVALPEAMRVERVVAGGKLTVRGVQGPSPRVVVRWKPQVQELDTRLVFASTANTIATFTAGEMKLDALVRFDVVQGKLNELVLTVPAGLSVTQVRGGFIQDWRVVGGKHETRNMKHESETGAGGKHETRNMKHEPETGTGAGVGGDAGVQKGEEASGNKVGGGAGVQGEGAATRPGDVNVDRKLVVTLNRVQTERYVLQVLAEAPLPGMPTEFKLPVMVPVGGIRASGHVVVGTDSAIQLLVRQAGGVSQIEGAAFPRAAGDAKNPRVVPTGKAFFYSYASTPYQLALGLDEVVPAYDASQRMVVQVKEDDLAIEAEVELDVRDARVRGVTLEVPGGYAVSGVGGPEVEDYVVGGKHETRNMKHEAEGGTGGNMKLET